MARSSGTLIVDTGQDLVGILSASSRKYRAYYGSSIRIALARIGKADELVTYNGKAHDLEELKKFSVTLGCQFRVPKIHTDMRAVIWSERIWGRGLLATYKEHFNLSPDFSNTHVGSNECDCYMTFQLWKLWKQQKLKIVDGSGA